MTFRITNPGFYHTMTAVEYFADPCPEPSLTQSICKVLLDQSPLHARCAHPRFSEAHEDEDAEKYSAAHAIGNAAHAILIGRGKEIAVGEWDNWRTKEAQTFRKLQTDNGHMPILSKHMATAQSMVNAAHAQLNRAGWSSAFHPDSGNGEVVACWEEKGIWFRTMIDWLTPDCTVCYDLKTSAASFAPHVIGRKMVDDGWDVQAAMHERALNALDPDGAGRRKFRFVALENYLPFALVPVELSETWLTMGRKKLAIAIDLWREAITSGKFEGYPSSVQYPEYPGYAESQWLGREMEYADRPAPGKMLNDLSGG